MKYLILFLFIVATTGIQVSIGVPQESALTRFLQFFCVKDDFVERYSDCINTSGVDEEDAKMLQHGNIVDKPQLKQFLFCINQQNNIQDRNGNFDTDLLRQKLKNPILSSDLVDTLINKCIIHQATPQESAYQFLKCSRSSIMINTDVS